MTETVEYDYTRQDASGASCVAHAWAKVPPRLSGAEREAAMVRAAARAQHDIAIIAAGSERHFSLEDAVCAGRFVRAIRRGLPGMDLNDGATAALQLEKRYGTDLGRLFREATHGRSLTDTGFAEDLALCGHLDAYPVIPVYQDRQITKLGPDRER